MLDFEAFKRRITRLGIAGFTIMTLWSILENLDELRYGETYGLIDSLIRHNFAVVAGLTLGVAIVYYLVHR